MVKDDPRGCDPFRLPDWRWTCLIKDYPWLTAEDAKPWKALPPVRRKKPDDVMLDRVRTPAWKRAYHIYMTGGPTRWEMEARLLTADAMDTIATKLHVDVDVVDNYLTYFFDVRRDGKPAGSGWIRVQVFGDGWPAANPPQRIIWMFMALSGGAVLLDVLVDHSRSPANAASTQIVEMARLLTRLQFTPLGDRKANQELIAEARRLARTSRDARKYERMWQQLDALIATFAPEPKSPGKAKKRKATEKTNTKKKAKPKAETTNKDKAMKATS